MESTTTAEKLAYKYNLYKLDRIARLELTDRLIKLEQLEELSKTLIRIAWYGEKGYETYTFRLSDAAKVIQQNQYKVDLKVWIV
jgi:hypothetical protein